jgi:hypothetical protein
MNPLGFLLTDLLHRKEGGDGLKLPTQLEKFRCQYSDEATDKALESKFARVLGIDEEPREWTNKRDLTKSLFKDMAALWKDDASVCVTHEAQLAPGRTSRKSDIMVLHTGSGTEREDLAALTIEVGLSNDQWWNTTRGFQVHTVSFTFRHVAKAYALDCLHPGRTDTTRLIQETPKIHGRTGWCISRDANGLQAGFSNGATVA